MYCVIRYLIVVFVVAFPWSAVAFEATFVTASTTEISNPHDVKLSPDGKLLYVSDVGNSRVVVLEAQSLKLVGHFGKGEQSGTHDVEFGPDRRLYVADTGNPAYLGAAPMEELAKHIGASHGPSGSNRDYVLQLAQALRELGEHDPHVLALESLLAE